MKFYLVQPTNKYSPSRHWFVDEVGLVKVKNKYTKYGRDPNNTIDRWSDFEAKVTNKVWFDFGDMLRVNTPSVKEIMYGTTFELFVTHIPSFLEALKSPHHMDEEYWQCSGRYHNYVFSEKVRDSLMEKFSLKEKLYNEMIEGFNKEMDDVIAKSNHVVSINKYHKSDQQ